RRQSDLLRLREQPAALLPAAQLPAQGRRLPQPQRADTGSRCEGRTAFKGGDRNVNTTASPRTSRSRGERGRHHLVVPSCRLGAMPDRAIGIVRENTREYGVCRTSLFYRRRLFDRGSDQGVPETEAIRGEHTEASIDDWLPGGPA